MVYQERIKQVAFWMFRVGASAIDRFYVDNGLSRAAALAYTTLLSLVPLMAFAFGLLGAFAASSEQLAEVRAFIFQQFVPKMDESGTVLDYLSKFSEQIAGLNSLVLVALVVTSLFLISSVESALNEVWQVHETRSFANRIAIFSAILVLTPILALSAFYFSNFQLEPLINELVDSEPGIASQFFGSLYRKSLPYVFDVAAFSFLYFLVPKAPVRFKSALTGALIAAFLFGVAKFGFVIYIEQFSAYARVYSTLAAVPIFLFWLYLAWVIVLLGCQISYQVQYLPLNGALWQRNLMSVGSGGFVLAIQALCSIAYAYRDGKPLPNDVELAEALDCSTVVLRQSLRGLERGQIIQRGDSRDMPLVLTKSPAAITVNDLESALQPRAVGIGISGTRYSLKYARELSRVVDYIAKRDCGEKCKTLTLEDLLCR